MGMFMAGTDPMEVLRSDGLFRGAARLWVNWMDQSDVEHAQTIQKRTGLPPDKSLAYAKSLREQVAGWAGSVQGIKRIPMMFHGIKEGRSAVDSVLSEGFTKGVSSGKRIPGTSISEDPLVSLHTFGRGDPKNVVGVDVLVPPSQIRNLSPGEYAAGVDPPHAVRRKANFRYNEGETFAKRKELDTVSETPLRPRPMKEVEARYLERSNQALQRHENALANLNAVAHEPIHQSLRLEAQNTPSRLSFVKQFSPRRQHLAQRSMRELTSSFDALRGNRPTWNDNWDRFIGEFGAVVTDADKRLSFPAHTVLSNLNRAGKVSNESKERLTTLALDAIARQREARSALTDLAHGRIPPGADKEALIREANKLVHKHKLARSQFVNKWREVFPPMP